jgi:energy-coupling factor transporter transmembrane protein EcfT
MILILFLIWLFLVLIAGFLSVEKKWHWGWLIWGLFSLTWIIPIFTGINIKNNEGIYKGYVVSVEQTGAIFKGWNVYLKTELESSNEEMACIDRNNQELIDALKEKVKTKENVVLEYEGVWHYKIGECPGSNWKVIKIQNN